jgi:antitoxin component YwqK of YwqJK toxin-antitoxin module
MRSLLLATACWLGLSASAQPPAAINQKDAQGRKQGPWERTWKDSKQLRYKGRFKDDKPVGTFTYYSTDGKVESVVDHYATGGASHGRHFHPNGKVMAEGRYLGEQKDSVWNYYDVEGRLRSTERWAKGVMDGDQEAFFANGAVAERCRWKAGKRNGPCEEFFDNGQVRRSTPYVNDVAEGEANVYFLSGKREESGRYVKGQRHGPWYIFNEDGSVRIQILYENDQYVKDKKENGVFKEYYEDDQPKSEVMWKSGRKQGPFKEYHANGHWMERPVKVGPAERPKSDMERVLEGQTVKREGTYVNDLLEGEVKEYDESGRLVRSVMYVGGKEK